MSLFKRSRAEEEPFDLVPREVEFVMVLLRDEDPLHTAALVRAVVNRAVETQGLVLDMHSSLVTVVYGTMADYEEPPDARQRLVKLLSELGPDLRVVHGRTRALVGNVGDHGRYTFTVLMPAHAEKLRALLDLEPGRALELLELSP